MPQTAFIQGIENELAVSLGLHHAGFSQNGEVLAGYALLKAQFYVKFSDCHAFVLIEQVLRLLQLDGPHRRSRSGLASGSRPERLAGEINLRADLIEPFLGAGSAPEAARRVHCALDCVLDRVPAALDGPEVAENIDQLLAEHNVLPWSAPLAGPIKP